MMELGRQPNQGWFTWSSMILIRARVKISPFTGSRGGVTTAGVAGGTWLGSALGVAGPAHGAPGKTARPGSRSHGRPWGAPA